ncbi:MAG: VanZ family protein [Desulfobacterales bacterium]|jgi:glycopeptide antibiotics resistance protein
MTMEKKYQNTLSYALLIYMCIIVVFITLIPFEFRIPEEFKITWSTNFGDFIRNIFLFIPIGFLFRLNRRHNKDILCLTTLIFGFLLSSAIEFAQIFIPGRYTQVIDVVTNGFGAWLGGTIFKFLGSQMKRKRSGSLFELEFPLMGLIYLLIPLMWLNGLATGTEETRLWLLLLLAIMGSGIIGFIYVNRFKHAGTIGYTKLAVFTLCWFVFCSLPVMISFPLKIAYFGISIVFAVQIFVRLIGDGKPREKRFEIPTIKKLMPIYIIYLLLLAVWPTTITADEWQYNIIFEELAYKERIVLTFRFVEFVSAFTVLGYMIAEMRGRKNESVETTLGWTFFIAAGSAIIIEIVKAYPALSGISILSIVIITSASIYGAVIYRLQLSAIERLNF